jgi:hypothetical protein
MNRVLAEKFWRETRMKLGIGFFVVASFLLLRITVLPAIVDPKFSSSSTLGAFHAAAPAGSPEFRSQLQWRVFLDLAAGMLAPLLAILLNSAGFDGRQNGSHPSVYFSLALPVSRRRWFLSRSLFGVVATLALVSLFLLGGPALSKLSALRLSWDPVGQALVSVWIGSIVWYGFGTLAFALFNETYGGLLAFATLIVCFVLAHDNAWPGVIGFMQARWVPQNAPMPWLESAAWLITAAALLGAALFVVERKDF